MKPTQMLADWITRVGDPRSCADLPVEVRETLGHVLLDTLACGLYGRSLEWTRIVEAWAKQDAGHESARPGLASIWGDSAATLRPSAAALVNGVAAHAYELDDYHPTKIHPGAVVIPAALATAEVLDASGERLLRAIAAGYETMSRVGLALDPSAAKNQGWHVTGVVGTLGAAAAASVMLGLDSTRTAWALGLAGTQSCGLFAFSADGAMSKRFHAGDAARAGVVAAELAGNGFTGPTQVLEAADGGLLKAFSPASAAPETVVEGLGQHWLLLGTAFKPYACCGSLHAYIDAALELRARLGIETVARARTRIGLPQVVEVQSGFDYVPGTALIAQLNARFCVASALRYGRVLPEEFADERLCDAETLALMARIEQRHDPELDAIYPENYCGWVEIEREPDSNEFERVYRQDPSGAAVNPDKHSAMREKVRQLLSDCDNHLIGKLEATCLDAPSVSARQLVARLVLGETS